MSTAPVIHIGICGLGTVGQGVWKHIERALPDLEARLGATSCSPAPPCAISIKNATSA
jgi:homoserine dehydrogenase